MASSSKRRVPACDRRLQILEAARDLFARHGFEGTRTRQIARRARVNEALIYRHFKSKDDLYQAVIDHLAEIRGGLQALEERLGSGRSDREIFAGIARDILERRAQDDTLSRMVLFSALEDRRRSRRVFESHVAAYYRKLADHIRHRMDDGGFRPVDPMLAARGFLGMVVYHSLVQDLFGARQGQEHSLAHVSETLTDIWLGGVRAHPGARPAAGGKTP